MKSLVVAALKGHCPFIIYRQKLRWATTQGGPELPKEVIDFQRPLDLCYFPNYFKAEKKPEAKIGFFKLRSSSAPDRTSINLVATCCNTTMLIEHPL